jgi:sodium-independent sulfate anion transporter 11
MAPSRFHCRRYCRSRSRPSGDVLRHCIDYSIFPLLSLCSNLQIQLATLPAQFGLYSSFAGVLLYWVCSKVSSLSSLITYIFIIRFLEHPRILASGYAGFFHSTWGVEKMVFQPVAVMSLTVAQIIAYVDAHHPHEFTANAIATLLAFICGIIALGLGLLRLGWFVEFIPLPAVSGFITGSALNIIASQIPGLMGITGFK